MESPAYDLDAVRRRIPLLRTRVPLNSCSQAPPSVPVRDGAEAFLASWDTDGMDWDAWMAEVEAARAAFAGLVGGEARDVAVTTSVSQATASVATGLDWTAPRRGVVVSGAEFPTVAHVWLAQERFGARVRPVPLREGRVHLEDYGAVVGEDTAVVSACSAFYETGVRQDLAAIAEIAHDRGALLYVDAYQTLGTEPFDAPGSGADFVASGSLKYLMGTAGIAFLWVRPAVAERLTPAVTGWFGRREPFAFDARTLDWADGARRLDTGTPPVLAAYVARAGMAWLAEVGLDAVGAWTRELRRRCVQGARARGLRVVGGPDEGDTAHGPDGELGPAGPGAAGAHPGWAPTTAVACEDAHAVEVALRERGVLVSARGPAVRLAPHFFNTAGDVERGLDELAAVLGERVGAVTSPAVASGGGRS